MKLKVTTVGSSAGIVLPKEILTKLKVVKGDFIFLTESPDGFRITPYDPEFEEDMALARKFMRERRDLLRELANDRSVVEMDQGRLRPRHSRRADCGTRRHGKHS